MPRKTKETIAEKTVKNQKKLDEKINALIENIIGTDKMVVDVEKNVKKLKIKPTATNAKTSASMSDDSTSTKKITKVSTKVKAEKASPKKSTKKDSDEKVTKKPAKKVVSLEEKEEDKPTKKVSTRKANKSSESTTKSTTAKPKTSTTKTTTRKKSARVASPTIVEYYDLPYKYNQTVVKVLYQNPTTLFVYWEISDSDIEYYKNTYGDNFFETTRPILVVYNDTMNYSFEISINDFANSWYFNINDSKCDYRVELIRRPIFYNEKIKTDYIHITSSNKIETPNDRILFSTNEPYTVYFKNTQNNNQRKVNLPKLLEKLNLENKDFGFPIVRNVYDLYKNIYHIEDIEEFSISLTNPSSGNPSSHSLSSRFI